MSDKTNEKENAFAVDKTDETEIVYVVHNADEEKPWEIKFDDVSGLKKARAILNYPVHKFETEAKATEVAEMLRDIIKADVVKVIDENDNVKSELAAGPAAFYHEVQAEEKS